MNRSFARAFLFLCLPLVLVLPGRRIDAGKSEMITMEFSYAQKVEIIGYDESAMEPFISRDDKFLFFNNSNDPSERTDLFYARHTQNDRFQFMGRLKGANLPPPVLDAVASMDRDNRFYFTSTRDYDKTFLTIFSGIFHNERVWNVGPVAGDFSKQKLGWITMDSEISADGNVLYCSDAFFPALGSAVPALSDIKIAKRDVNSRFVVAPDSDAILRAVNTSDLEYAPSISVDGLELFFTRLALKSLETKILRAGRATASAPFGDPEIIGTISGFAEAPSISADGKTLYFHKKEGNKYALYKVMRERPAFQY